MAMGRPPIHQRAMTPAERQRRSRALRRPSRAASRIMIFGEAIRDLHLELTSRCTLACPRCQRTADPEQLVLGDLPLEVVHRELTRAQFPEVAFVNLCGNYGDPIYHPQFHEMLRLFKAQGFKVRIETNGSYRTPAWWATTATILQRGDRLTFSIDGLEDTNPVYRVNARWPDIMAAVAAMRGRAWLIWKMIVFRHNQHQVDAARELAGELGFDEFRLVRSNRFGTRWAGAGGIDPLEPDQNWVSDRKQVARAVDRSCVDEVTITPRCAKGENIFVSSEGYLLPCCYSHIFMRQTLTAPDRHGPHDRWFERNREHFNLNRRAAAEILADPVWLELRRSWGDGTAPRVCYRQCGVVTGGDFASPVEVRRRDRVMVKLQRQTG